MIYALDGISPQIHPTAWIAPSAVVIGNVILGEGASVWFNAVLRGDNEPMTIGPRCNVQDGSVLHSDPGFPLTLEEDVTVGHLAMIHGCHIGAGALIGMKSTILNGARIGAGALLGAGSLVPEGRVVEAGKLTLGSPAKAIRDLSEAEIQRCAATAAHYTQNAKRFREGLDDLA